MAAITLADVAAAVCVVLVLWIFVFGGRIWKQPRLIRTLWQPETRDEVVEALRQSQRTQPVDDEAEDEHRRG